MNVIDRLGRLLFVGIEGTALAAEDAAFLEEVRPGGVILFSRNVESAEQLRALTGSIRKRLREESPFPLLAIDQEWGTVNRLEALTPPLPAAAELGRRGALSLCREAGRITGTLLRWIGIDVNMAPVLDLRNDDLDNGIGPRAFAADPNRVAALAGAYVDGLHGAGVAGVLKHFPGLGSSRVDSHRSLPTIETDAGTLWDVDLLPFRRLLSEHPKMPVMVGHGFYPTLERGREAEGGEVPASLSPSVIGDLLRGRMAHQGVVMTDDLEMGALTGSGENPFAVVRALIAGADWMLICRRKDRVLAAREEMIREVRGSAVLRRMSESSLYRLSEFSRRHAASAARRGGEKGTLDPSEPSAFTDVRLEVERFLDRWAG